MTSGVYTISTENLPTTGMLMWLRADAITGVSNGGVGEHLDRLRAATATMRSIPIRTARSRPPTSSSDFNGLPAVRFSGDNLLQVSSLPLGPYTIAAVFNTTGNPRDRL